MNNCYKFIVQAREVYKQYLSILNDLENDIKNFEDIPEPLIEVPIDFIPAAKSPLPIKESPIATNFESLKVNDIKIEPAPVESTWNADENIIENTLHNNDIKEEKPDVLDDHTETKSSEKGKISTLINYQEQKDLSDDPTYEEER